MPSGPEKLQAMDAAIAGPIGILCSSEVGAFREGRHNIFLP